jgi:hypothetical protein
LTGTAVFFTTAVFGSVFLGVTEAFFAGALDATAGLAVALPVVFAADLLGAATALRGFFSAVLAAVAAFETALVVALFAVFFTAATFGLAAGLAEVAFFSVVLAVAFAGCADFFVLADEDRSAALPLLAGVAELFTGFLVVAMDQSTIGS